MRQEAIARSLLRRVSLPANLLMVGLVGGTFCISMVLLQAPGTSLRDLVAPFLLLFGHLALDPVPWQWTGTDADRAGLGRGFGQALGFDLLWIGLVLASLHLLWGPGMPLPPRLFSPPPLLMPPRDLPPFRQNPFMPSFGLHRPPTITQVTVFQGSPFLPGLGLGLVNLAFALAYGWVSAEKEATDAKERRTADLLRHARAQALQGQLNPHVLYNALNGLTELVHEDPLAAEEVIVRLADLYRMLTVHGDTGVIRLGQERELVEAYLAMEQMRLGDRLQVQWQWPAWADQLELPPFFLLPLVENAIKHGISPAAEGGRVVLSCVRTGTAVQLLVENTGCPFLGRGQGVGLSNLETRLGLWTELSASFKLEARGPWTAASVQWLPEVP
jgi:hypothetical protein